MSYWISLRDVSEVVLDTNIVRAEGGTYILEGMSEAELNVTWNYAKHFNYQQLGGLTAENALKLLRKAISSLNDDCDEDYWKPTEGNVKESLVTLAEFAEFAVKNKIKAVFNVS